MHPDGSTEANGIIHHVYGLAAAFVFAQLGTWFLFPVYVSVPYQTQPQDMKFSTYVPFMSPFIFNLIKKLQMMPWQILH